MKPNRRLVLRSVLIGFILVVGVPIFINELYKIGPGYITLWDARDVLSYYGTVLGAIIAVITLSATILFTRKQIIAENTRKAELEKWEKVDALVQKTLVEINPQRIAFMIIEETPVILSVQSYTPLIAKLELYSYNAKMSLNYLKCLINPDEYKVVEQLTSQIIDAINYFCELSEKYVDFFSKTQSEIHAPPHLFGDKSASAQLDADSFKSISKEIYTTADAIYQPLLNSKRDVFAAIYKEINDRANQRLSWLPKKECLDND